MNWSYQQLLSFHTVALGRSMTAAAGQLGYTTGAVSQQIAGLEASLGTPLFFRLPRGLKLTDEGELFLRETERIIQAYRHTSAVLETLASPRRLSLRLGIFTSAAVAFLPEVLAQLKSSHPLLEVHSTEVYIADAMQALMSGSIDASLTVQYPNIPTPRANGISVEAVDNEPFLILSSTPTLWNPRSCAPLRGYSLQRTRFSERVSARRSMCRASIPSSRILSRTMSRQYRSPSRG